MKNEGRWLVEFTSWDELWQALRDDGADAPYPNTCAHLAGYPTLRMALKELPESMRSTFRVYIGDLLIYLEGNVDWEGNTAVEAIDAYVPRCGLTDMDDEEVSKVIETLRKLRLRHSA